MTGEATNGAPRPSRVRKDSPPPQDHHPHTGHMHCHGPGCGHESVPHETHVDYIHGGHRHTRHGQHYDDH